MVVATALPASSLACPLPIKPLMRYDDIVKLARINTVLLVAIIVINTYLIVLPFSPNILSWFQGRSQQTAHNLARSLHAPSVSVALNDNRLIVPSMGLDEPINDGPDLSTLRKGLWRLPFAATPDKGSNTVIVGHRFTYTNPRGTLYYLNKVHVGDEIGIFWRGKRYVYHVTKTAVVPASAVSIEAPTPNAQLTLYTCTPLWWPKDRLVVTAVAEGQS